LTSGNRSILPLYGIEGVVLLGLRSHDFKVNDDDDDDWSYEVYYTVYTVCENGITAVMRPPQPPASNSE